MHRFPFNRTPLAAGVALALGVSAAPQVAAQDDAREEVIEEIITTGIRGSLMRSMDVKRGSSGVVDAISAEDIGKFPDQNLAESLQRITGVSIQRERGEGNQVTVRGFGPEYNLVTINGRQMPTHNGVNRSFDFADLASEGVAGVQVYKTGRADVPSGGVGSTINITTPQPLKAEPTASLAAKTVFDRSTRTGDEITPEFSGIYLGRFLDDTLGIAITASHQVRNNGVNTGEVGGWYTRPGDDILPGETEPESPSIVPNDENQINRPQTADERYSLPQSMAYRIAEYETERNNAQLVLQWAPTDNVTTTLDFIRSEFDLERSYSDLSAWFSNTAAQLGRTSSWTDGPIASPIYYYEPLLNADFAMGTGEDGSRSLNESIGFNVEWWVNDQLSLALDYHDSSAEKRANSPYGTSALITMASFNKVGQTFIGGYELPIMVLDLNSGGEENRPLYKDDMRITGSVFSNAASWMDLEQAKISGSFADFFEGSSIDFGVQMTEVSNRSVGSVVQLNTWGGITQPGEISDILVRSSIAGQFDDLSGHDYPGLQTEYFTTTIAQLAAAGEAYYAASGDEYQAVGDCGTGYCASTDWGSDLRTTEESTAVYLQYNWTGEISDMPANLKVGVRYEETEVRSAAFSTIYDRTEWVNAGNELNIIPARNADGTVVRGFSDVLGEYDVTLPNLDFDIEPWEDMVLRLSVSETITRPNYENIKGGLTVTGSQFFGNTNPSATSGNPGLIPVQSFNVDLSFEWYYDDGSYFSVGYFEKDVDNFIGTGRETVPLFNIPNIIGGTLYNRAVAESGLDPGNYPAVARYILDNYQDDPQVDGDTITSIPGDPAVLINVSRPVNQKTAKVDGIELNLQHNFGDSGFGFIVNATFADADVAYDNFRSLEGQFVLNGLSDSANVVAFYDGEDLQIRLAYNWRDNYLAGVGQGQGTLTNPTNFEAYGQWDLGVTYYFNDSLTFYFSGLNITNETAHVYGLVEEQVLQGVQLAPRYDFGVRYNFDF